MKKIRYCKITILILAGWAILSAIGFLGKRYDLQPLYGQSGKNTVLCSGHAGHTRWDLPMEQRP